MRNYATIGLIGKSGLYLQTLDYLAYHTSDACIRSTTHPVKNPVRKPFRLDIAEYEVGHDITQAFGTPFSLLDEMGALDLRPSSEDIIKFTKLHYVWGRFGYLSITSLNPNMGDYQKVIEVIRGILIKEMAGTNGLIIDVRNNPGGSIQLAEG